MKINLKSFFCRNRLYFVAFFIPVILLILTFAVMGIYPFGENQIPVIDMYHQYIPFLSELQYKLAGGRKLVLHMERCRRQQFLESDRILRCQPFKPFAGSVSSEADSRRCNGHSADKSMDWQAALWQYISEIRTRAAGSQWQGFPPFTLCVPMLWRITGA